MFLFGGKELPLAISLHFRNMQKLQVMSRKQKITRKKILLSVCTLLSCTDYKRSQTCNCQKESKLCFCFTEETKSSILNQLLPIILHNHSDCSINHHLFFFLCIAVCFHDEWTVLSWSTCNVSGTRSAFVGLHVLSYLPHNIRNIK